MIFTDRKTREQRMDTCRNREFFKPDTVSCGTFLPDKMVKQGTVKGDLVKVEGRKKKVRLCGCHMGQKVKFKIASCPVGFWKSEVNLSDKLKLKSILKGFSGKMKGSDLPAFVDAYNNAFGAGKKVKDLRGCGGCFSQMIDESIKSLENE